MKILAIVKFQCMCGYKEVDELDGQQHGQLGCGIIPTCDTCKNELSPMYEVIDVERSEEGGYAW